MYVSVFLFLYEIFVRCEIEFTRVLQDKVSARV